MAHIALDVEILEIDYKSHIVRRRRRAIKLDECALLGEISDHTRFTVPPKQHPGMNGQSPAPEKTTIVSIGHCH